MNNMYQKTLNAYQRRTDASASSINNDWSSDIENVLEQIRVNCVIMSKEHKSKYLFLKGILRYFRIPIILISSVASVASVGLQPYLDQPTISVITCLLSLTCGIIGSIELFLAIQSSMENELMASKDYYILSIEIFKVLTLDRENRSMDGKSFLETSYGTYVKLIENSNILDEKIADRLTLVTDKSAKYIDSSSSDESPIPPPSPNNKSTILTYFCNKKQNKKNTIEKTQSIDELVESSLKKNNILALESSHLRRPRVLPHLRPKDPDLIPKIPPHLQLQNLQLQTPILYQSTAQEGQPTMQEVKPTMQEGMHNVQEVKPTMQEVKPTMQEVKPTMQEGMHNVQEVKPTMQEVKPTMQEVKPTMQEVKPTMQEVKPTMQDEQLHIQLQQSYSHNNLFSDNLSDPFFYNNFMQLPKTFSNNQLPKSISDSNLQHSNEEINNDIIGISDHNLLDF
jgi:hypothetical protein